MNLRRRKQDKRLLIPEVVQTSAMDCGPASLKCLFEGFRIPISYGRLREACQTDVDGTSIDALEDVAVQLGLEAEQIMIPLDHIFLPEANALPAIIVVRLPDSSTHFVVAWNNFRGVVQIMDPAAGRRWLSMQDFLNDVYVHVFPVSAADWREWAGTDEFLLPLRRRISALSDAGERLVRHALDDSGWRSLAILDAGVRMTRSLVQSGAINKGRQSAALLDQFVNKAWAGPRDETRLIPESFWSVRPVADAAEDELNLKGAVLVRALGKRTAPVHGAEQMAEPLSPELQAALDEKPVRPLHELFCVLKKEGWTILSILFLGLFMSAGLILLEALIFRGIIDGWDELRLGSQRFGGVIMVLLFAAGLLLLELSKASGVFRLGRRLEIRLRMAFLKKIPKLKDRYFSSRPISDMAHRSHLLHILRKLPDLGAQFFVVLFEILITTAGIIWIAPSCLWLALAAAAVSLLLPLFAMPFLNEHDMRLQTHNGALGKFYLDALLGLTPIKTHGAEESVRREHENLTVEWGRAGLGFHRMMVFLEGAQMLSGFAFAGLILARYVGMHEESSWILLLVYWSLNLPVLGQHLVTILQQIPAQRNITSRLLEPLGAPEEKESEWRSLEVREKAAAILFKSVSVHVAGHAVLHDLNIDIKPGMHVAVLGPSGAGKSTLISLLLGWNRPAQGRLTIDSTPYTDAIEQLHQETVWIDPTVQLWNRSLYENIIYGRGNGASSMETILDQANLMPVLQKLPDGMQTRLGESGGLVSGGEGQRVRVARAMRQTHPRLVLLDEPFRGLEHSQRQQLLKRLRNRWADSTLLCVTHDIAEALSFDRVLVLQNGRLVEDDDPASLLKNSESIFSRLLEKEKAIRSQVWSDSKWRKLIMQDGRLHELNGSLPQERPQQKAIFQNLQGGWA